MGAVVTTGGWSDDPVSVAPHRHARAASARPPRGPTRLGGVNLVLVVLNVAALIFLVLSVVGYLNRSATGQFDASIQWSSLSTLYPTEVSVSVVVRNVGSTPAVPECTVNLGSAGDAYTGSSQLTSRAPISPGQETRLTGTVFISDEGAAFLSPSASTVECT